MKKQYPTDAITNELAGASAFFQPSAPENPAVSPLVATPPSDTPTQDSVPDPTKQSQQEERTSSHHDVMLDVTTAMLEDVDLKRWREQIEDTETQNSSLRLTSQERYVIEDVIRELQR